ncbi:hypothetical protein [Enterococcus mundtii]|uniref:hypothetical protein n=1 Tax=Enterococcus mundtii TaxID=53346 RepID=UPI000DF9E1D3|nr:hypothetical protein [Enterococcus mundtii]STE38098.1 Uncharacterised protein [Enterococcus mundtii]
MDKLRNFNILEEVKTRPKYKIVVIAMIVFAILFSIGFAMKNNVKLDVTESVRPKFEGYSGHGELNYNSPEIKDEITRYLLEKEGVKQEIIDGIQKADESVMFAVMSDVHLAAKVSKVEDELDTLEYGFDKQENLKNGDEVKFTLTNTIGKAPIKSVEKTFKVKGLKESSTFTLEDVLKDHPITFDGYEGEGSVNKSLSEWFTLPKNNGELSNSEKIQISLRNDYIEDKEFEGKFFTGDTDKEFEVSGLKSYLDLENIEDVLKQTDDYVKSLNKDEDIEFLNRHTNYEISRIHSYIAPDTGYWSYNDDEDSYDTKAKVTSIYKIDKTETRDDKVVEEKTTYELYGYEDLKCNGNKLDTSEMQRHAKNHYASLKDEEAAISEINSNSSDYKEIE